MIGHDLCKFLAHNPFEMTIMIHQYQHVIVHYIDYNINNGFQVSLLNMIKKDARV